MKRVFIMDDAEALLPRWLRFVRGVVDSSDLPLNVSRELLQDSRIVKTIRKAITKQVLDLLREVADERPDDYRRIVERWIVPDYDGAAKPRAILETARGTIELELYPGDAPLGLEYLIRVIESGEIAGTSFPRVVPNFVIQQQAIRNDVVLRDEVSRRGLTRGNLSWASSGLDTGRPGYTLGITPQPHNEGNFTALGRIVRGMDVVERLELGDTVTAARMVK